MNHRPGILLYLVLLSVFTGYVEAQQQTGQTATQTPRRSMREIVMTPVVYRVAGMDKVQVKSDLKYTSANNPHLLMDVYTPPGLAKNERRPAVLFIHGGAGAENTPKDWGIYTSWGRLVAASGMVGVTFTHRLGFPKPLLSEAASDVNAALNHIRTNADSLNIDKDRICLAAYSAGGPMLSMAMRDKPQYVRCLVAFYAFMDIQQSELHRTNETPEMVGTFSPITYLANDAGKIAPIFIARAGLDEIPTMNDSIDRFTREAISKNAAITVANHPQGDHGFDNQNDDERSREIIQSAVAFMKLHLGVTETALALAQTESNQVSNPPNIEQQIMQLEKEGREAALKNDVEANDRLLADNWMNTNANGTVTTKARLMELLKSSPFKIMSIEDDDVMVRVYGDSAVVTGRSTSKRMGQDNAVVTGQVRFTRVYAKRQGRWQVVAAQSTPIRQQ